MTAKEAASALLFRMPKFTIRPRFRYMPNSVTATCYDVRRNYFIQTRWGLYHFYRPRSQTMNEQASDQAADAQNSPANGIEMY
ncbi:hypothetical protein, partial [uncultured Ellagibacter sp.]|uniref:hypothetical protein n=1 Tax=uncultured Ellagibacter sp. TaxID=2137580 RepID=UPI002633F3A6